MSDLTPKSCQACESGTPPLSEQDQATLKAKLNPAWEINTESQILTRTFKFQAFAKAVYTANLAAYISDSEGHHADVSFGWGYCTITYTSHELGRLSENDFICAAKLDAVTS